jgi:hypothetical protein
MDRDSCSLFFWLEGLGRGVKEEKSEKLRVMASRSEKDKDCP